MLAPLVPLLASCLGIGIRVLHHHHRTPHGRPSWGAQTEIDRALDHVHLCADGTRRVCACRQVLTPSLVDAVYAGFDRSAFVQRVPPGAPQP
jgi:hypothetical protein